MDATTLTKRQYYYDDCYGRSCNSSWSTWGRWVLLVALVVVVLLIFFVFSCLNARRRRARGAAPYRGTGWLAPGHGPVNYYGPGGPNQGQHYGGQGGQQYQSGYEQYNAAPAPPAYQHSNTGYYGQETGLEMQPPQQGYQPAHGAAGAPVYAPPTGAPPGKEGIVR